MPEDTATGRGQCPYGVYWQATRDQLPPTFWAVTVSIWFAGGFAPKVMLP